MSTLMMMSSTLHCRRTKSSSFNLSVHEMKTALPLQYQSGYLTIKDYDRDTYTYKLGIPNDEVRVGLYENFMQELTPNTIQGWESSVIV